MNAIEQINEQLTKAVGGSNPNQILTTMMMSRTTLDSKTSSYNIEKRN